MRKILGLIAALVLATFLSPNSASAQETRFANISEQFGALSKLRVGETRFVLPYRIYGTWDKKDPKTGIAITDPKIGFAIIESETPVSGQEFSDDRYILDAVKITRIDDVDGKREYESDFTGCDWEFAQNPRAEQKFEFKAADGGTMTLGPMAAKTYCRVTIKRGNTKMRTFPVDQIRQRLYSAMAYEDDLHQTVWVSARFLHFAKQVKGDRHYGHAGWFDGWAPFRDGSFSDSAGQAIKVVIPPLAPNRPATALDVPFWCDIDLLGVTREWKTALSWQETVTNPSYPHILFANRGDETKLLRAEGWMAVRTIRGSVPKGDAGQLARK